MFSLFEGSFAYQFFYGVFKDTIALEMAVVFFRLWFVWLPIFLGYIFVKMWLSLVRDYYILNDERGLFGIKVARGTKKKRVCEKIGGGEKKKNRGGGYRCCFCRF